VTDPKLAALSLKNLKKLSERAAEATDRVLIGGLTTELITENRTLGLE